MIFTILKRALGVLMKKPFALWGVSLLSSILSSVVWALFGIIPGLALGIVLLLSTSMTMIYLEGYRGNGVKAADLFYCFKDGATAKRVLGGMAWMWLWIFLWSLIPFVGFIFAYIRIYEYRLVPYILMTEPEVSPTNATKESSKRTKGYKGKMFLTDLLIGACVAAAFLILSLFSAIPFIGVLFGLVLFVFSICCVALLPLYQGLVQAAFYEEISNPTIPVYAAPVYANNAYGAPYNPNAQPQGVQPQSAQPAGGHMFCPRCGTALPANSAFCTSCGTRIN